MICNLIWFHFLWDHELYKFYSRLSNSRDGGNFFVVMSLEITSQYLISSPIPNSKFQGIHQLFQTFSRIQDLNFIHKFKFLMARVHQKEFIENFKHLSRQCSMLNFAKFISSSRRTFLIFKVGFMVK